MGLNMVLRLHEKGHEVLAWNRSAGPRDEARKQGVMTYDDVELMIKDLPRPRTVWVMVLDDATEDMIATISSLLGEGDTVIDGGNSFYRDTVSRSIMLREMGINFLDAGVSGGPRGAREGACVMVGGDKDVFNNHKKLFEDVSAHQALAYVGDAGAGHFVKMVHNGIEYGMMQAIAEGFTLLEKSDYDLDIVKIADLYNHGSVIESRLIGWLKDGFQKYGNNLDKISGVVAHTGEGKWTVDAAEKLEVEVPVIKRSFEFRIASADKPSFTGKLLSVLRNQFGGHDVKNK